MIGTIAFPITYTFPSLTAAAQRMTWQDFNAMTEQVVNSLRVGDYAQLKRILETNWIKPSGEEVERIAAGRQMFFGDEINETMRSSISAFSNYIFNRTSIDLYLIGAKSVFPIPYRYGGEPTPFSREPQFSTGDSFLGWWKMSEEDPKPDPSSSR